MATSTNFSFDDNCSFPDDVCEIEFYGVLCPIHGPQPYGPDGGCFVCYILDCPGEAEEIIPEPTTEH